MTDFTQEDFLAHVQNHVMTISNDDGVYRSILFKRPESHDRFFRITTWDGHLCISGDMGTYVFSRVHDMFNFFRDCKVNLYYWSEKVEAGECKEFSPELARNALNIEFESWEESIDKDIIDRDFIDEEKEKLNDINTDDYIEFVASVRDWVASQGGVRLDDFWEHSIEDYTYHYIWCCHAIVWAIAQYDASKGGES